MRKILFLEPFFGGSHRNFAEGLVAHSQHAIELLTLPARFWKWRLRGAALYFIKRIKNIQDYDAVLTTDLMSLADFKALAGPACPPTLVYFHENQLTYPLAPGESRDFQFGFTDISTSLAADRIIFNSQTHYNAFFDGLPGFINMMPEYRPKWVLAAIRPKSGVLYPGCRFDIAEPPNPPPENAPALIVWNHRWEFDKNPRDFFAALDTVLDRGMTFRLALLGENFQVLPKEFIAARERYGNRIVQYGYETSRTRYLRWLQQGAIVVSTAQQENFGISVVEAVRLGCVPLLPRRLAYPEVLPEAFHAECLYDTQDELVDKLCGLIADRRHLKTRFADLARAMQRFAWENLIERYDAELERLARLDRPVSVPSNLR